MTAPVRTQRRVAYPALFLFAIAYVSALAIIFAPDRLREPNQRAVGAVPATLYELK